MKDSQSIRFRRTQYPVGHGGFHFASICGGSRPLHYIYDCGATNRALLQPWVTECLARCGKEIDVLFLSHAHSDHVIGVPLLFRGET